LNPVEPFLSLIIAKRDVDRVLKAYVPKAAQKWLFTVMPALQ